MVPVTRVLFTIGSLYGGGAEHALCVLANQFVQRGIAVRICCLNDVEKPISYQLDPRVEYFHLAKHGYGKRYNMLWRMLALRRHIQQYKPDVVVAFMVHNAIQALACTLGMRVPIVVRPSSAPQREHSSSFAKTWVHRLFPRAAGAVFQNPCQQAYFSSLLHCPQTIIFNPVEPNPLWAQTRQYDTFTIIACGRMVESKNYSLLLEAFSRISPRFPGWRLEICGQGPQRDELQALACKIAPGTVTFSGFVDDIPQRLHQASIFAMPSQLEGMPNALVEAMCMGCACVTTDFDGGAARLLIQDEENGLLVPKNDLDAFAGALARLMTDGGLRQRLGEQALSLRAKVDAGLIADQWLEFLATAIAQKKVRKGRGSHREE